MRFDSLDRGHAEDGVAQEDEQDGDAAQAIEGWNADGPVRQSAPGRGCDRGSHSRTSASISSRRGESSTGKWMLGDGPSTRC
jgi:hypothetical protein